MTFVSHEKWQLAIVFSVQAGGRSRKGQDPEKRVHDQETGSPGRPVPTGLQVPGGLGLCRARSRPSW